MINRCDYCLREIPDTRDCKCVDGGIRIVNPLKAEDLKPSYEEVRLIRDLFAWEQFSRNNIQRFSNAYINDMA